MTGKQVLVLGVGNILLSDEGFGVRVIERLAAEYDFPDNVSIVDGGVLGINLLGVLSLADEIIVVDVVKNGRDPGTMYRIEKEEIPFKIRKKDSMHQVDLPETLTLLRAIDMDPNIVILGIEPLDMQTLCVELTETIATKVDKMIQFVLQELDTLGIAYHKRSEPCV